MPDTVAIPPGFGFRVLKPHEYDPSGTDLDGLLDMLLLWELPRRRHHCYVLGADIGDGIGQDRSVCDVTRVGTVEEPDEQVAQFVSNTIDPIDFAYVIDAIGRFYRDSDGQEALAAIETNNHGMATQAELMRHCGYTNFFVWRHEDTRIDKSPLTTRIGWVTNARTRPIMLSRYVKAIKTVDPHTGQRDYRINSPHTFDEMKYFQTEGLLVDAEAAPSQHDDCLMAGAISVHVAQTMHHDSREPLNEQRRRLSEERLRAQREAGRYGYHRRDYLNTDATADEALGREEFDGWDGFEHAEF